MQQSMVESCILSRMRTEVPRGIQDGKRNWANSARRCRTLAKSRTKKGNLRNSVLCCRTSRMWATETKTCGA